MKKKVLYLLISALSISALPSFVLAADDDATPETPTSSKGEYVKPTPQQTRIKGLILRLQPNYSHEIETIDDGTEDFLGLFNESGTGDPQGCVLFLHEDHAHPDWPQVISPLRRNLPSHSWCTLSIEVPDIAGRATPTTVPSNDSDSDSDNSSPTPPTDGGVTLTNEQKVFDRIDAALALIREKGYQNAAYLGHRSGAAYALKYVADRGIAGQALILVDIKTVPPASEYQLSQSIESLRIPVLDYYFDRLPSDHRFAQWRQQASNKRRNSSDAFVQIDALPDARFGNSADKRLEQRVWGFLKQNTTQSSQNKELPEFKKGLFYKSPVE
ncbi:alpha/beta hydrolase family protein [Marinomonas mediterranea]|jgi:Protein of unknown function (DUF3530).|uniref:DUF3530 family protein n=1 Tax=Marinomonas mediterranea (strain ATCC 700492 / JCM 21426 / NBRC 103028 / MMB-1) TaxID=717774 RepID=F2JT80_MARM1|nr:alpha/beta hydrolase family protein [Marinomonas mediterranea]ADZ90298.1 hypothetical protein Marme_1023 [Marinomonas mediterranea MMB-1]WCN08358.1 DUF3530 family protein [Marinomonas mediterranea]WCN12415.1 DUF3530 family protein [Marinomonas mediterranea]WCN16488.1 DUF3530 family protein [Marinomonas mediterranea MMB-1]